MSRQNFIESLGATCKNWRWSWSFVNTKDRFVVFGAWQHLSDPHRSLILSDSWERLRGKRSSPSFAESREHIRLVEHEGYRLFTFPMVRHEDEGDGPARLKTFEPALTLRTVRRDGDGWYAFDQERAVPLTEEVQDPESYLEGALRTVSVNAFERNRAARDACIAFYGPVCVVCGFDFEAQYGQGFRGFIHVHHLVPLASVRRAYKLDPVKDLRPVCPNCHAVIHYGNGLLSIAEVKERLHRARGA